MAQVAGDVFGDALGGEGDIFVVEDEHVGLKRLVNEEGEFWVFLDGGDGQKICEDLKVGVVVDFLGPTDASPPICRCLAVQHGKLAMR